MQAPLIGPESQESRADLTFDLLKKLGEARDGILVLIAVVYTVGYAVWSTNAYIRHLGLLPILMPQYLIAGSIPVLCILAAWALCRAVRLLSIKHPQNTTRAAMVVFIGLFLAVVSVLANRQNPILSHGSLFSSSTRLSTVVAFAAATKVIYDRIWEAIKDPNAVTKLGKPILLILMIIIGAIGFIAVVASMLIIYPAVPQEFGGVRPRNAHVILAADAIDPATLQQLCEVVRPPSTTGKEESKTPNLTREVTVYYSDSDKVILRLAKSRDSRVYEIKKDAIKAIVWGSD